MTRKRDLENEAKQFASKIRWLLNGTVCLTAQVNALLAPDRRFAVGTSLDRASLIPAPVQLASASPDARCWLNVGYRLYVDDRGYLTVHSSAYAVSTGDSGQHELFRYDYERGKTRYSDAHVQVFADCEPLIPLLAAAGRPRRALRHLHLPVGGRRFRPALEDVLEFLINEGIVEPTYPTWRDVLDRSRDRFRDIQLRALVARKHEVAADALRDCGYLVTAPAQSEGAKIFNLLSRRGSKRKR